MRKFVFFEEEESWQVKAARYCINSGPEGFEVAELRKYLQEMGVSNAYIQQWLEEQIQTPEGHRFPRAHISGRYFAPLSLITTLVDHDELKEARKNSKWAWYFSLGAIVLSAFSAWFQYISLP